MGVVSADGHYETVLFWLSHAGKVTNARAERDLVHPSDYYYVPSLRRRVRLWEGLYEFKNDAVHDALDYIRRERLRLGDLEAKLKREAIIGNGD